MPATLPLMPRPALRPAPLAPRLRRGAGLARLALPLALALLGSAASAETLRGAARVSAVTLYPEGASVTRTARLSLPAGRHRVVIPGLPEGSSPDSLRVAATGATIVAVSVQTARALPAELAEPEALTAARAALEAAERALREHDLAVKAILARAEAAKETAGFLRDLAKAEGAAQGDIAGLANAVFAQLLAARQEQLAAEREAAEADLGRARLLEAVETARRALEAAQPAEDTRAAAVIELEAPAAGEAEVALTTLSDAAGWRPVYDARLDRAARKLALERGVVVEQATGEDWAGVALTLSTARPTGQVMPSELDPEIVRLWDPDLRSAARAAAPSAPAMSMEDAAAPAMVEAAPAMAFDGVTVTYAYPSPVDLRSGADALRLALSEVELAPEIRAEAVPLLDNRATLVAEAPNAGELILPGEATLYLDGKLVGVTGLDTIAAGDELRLGFGPIDGLTVERRVDERAAGDRGLIARSNATSETVRLIAENLTAEPWPLRITDRVPVSEEEALSVRWRAEPAPTRTDPEGRRGILEWDATLVPGGRQEIVLTTEMAWPEGRELLRGM